MIMAERIIEGRIYPIGIQSFPEGWVWQTAGFPNYEVEVAFYKLIGANFNEDKEARGLEYEIEKLGSRTIGKSDRKQFD